MGTFDPETFLSQTIDAPNSTSYVPVPVGEYQAVIEKVEPRRWESRDGTSSGIALDIIWNIDDAKVKEHHVPGEKPKEGIEANIPSMMKVEDPSTQRRG